MFELFQSEANEKYYFHLKAKNSQIILASQAYADTSGAKNGIESVKTNCADDSKFERKTAANGKFHFNLKAANGQIIGTSQMYASEAGMEKGIESVKTNAPSAETEDKTV
ncbi:YegP family protein [Tamlana sp. I1]|uniref:YegP family protein n=1 Tax=Tamlana sp. I1 TaxID=2762061 RepID=UPI0018903EA7|nr:YegP family protein [Tamlana sp. I1]